MLEEGILLSGWKSIAFSVIAVGALLVSMFRLDELMTRGKSRTRALQRPMGNDRNGHIAFSDPDGREWEHGNE